MHTEPKAGLPRHTGHCIPPLRTLLLLHNPPEVEEEAALLETYSPLLEEVEVEHLKLERKRTVNWRSRVKPESVL